jgi:nucleoside-diphosphate-sugar epimerase
MQRILITGGAGFIGSHTVDYCLAQGANVIVFDDLSLGKLNHLNVFHPHLRIVQGDVLDYSLLLKEIKVADAILHLAAHPSVQKSIENPIHSLKMNTLAFLHVLQAIRESGIPKRLVYASSAAVYGHVTELPCSDDRALYHTALSPYALDKANNERYAELYENLYHIPSLGLRYFNVYGKRQDPHSPYSGVISKFMQKFADGEPLSIFGDGEQSRDFIHVEDVARANWLALQSTFTGAVNIASGAPQTLHQLVRYLEKIGGRPLEVNYLPERIGDIPKSYASVQKAQDLLKFKAEVGFEEGLKSIITY